MTEINAERKKMVEENGRRMRDFASRFGRHFFQRWFRSCTNRSLRETRLKIAQSGHRITEQCRWTLRVMGSWFKDNIWKVCSLSRDNTFGQYIVWFSLLVWSVKARHSPAATPHHITSISVFLSSPVSFPPFYHDFSPQEQRCTREGCSTAWCILQKQTRVWHTAQSFSKDRPPQN